MAIASLIGGIVQSNATRDAGNAAAAASNRAADLNMEQYKQTRADLLPFTQAGYSAQNRLMQLFGLSPGTAPAPAAPTAPVQPQAVPGASVGLPGGYQFIPGQWTGEGGGSPGLLLDAQGNIVGMGATKEDAMAQAGVSAAPMQPPPAGSAAPTASAATGATNLAAPGYPAMPGALPGPNSAVTPYTPPNNGVFDPSVEALAKTPGYQFQLAEGLKAIQATAAARGALISGRTQKEALRYGQGLAQTTYKDAENTFLNNLNSSIALNDQYWNRNINPLFDITRMGAGAATGTAQAGATAASEAGKLVNAGGQAQAVSGMAGARALTSGINSGLNNALYAYGRYNQSTPIDWSIGTDGGPWSP